MKPDLDIVVPVYANLELASRCLQSVVDAGLANSRLLIVDDGAAPKLADWLAEFADRHKAELLTHKSNLGFVQAVNTALDHAKGRDVLLLNSDTLVFPGWWQRLRDAAYSSSDISTVTPLSNNADICSYPLPPAAPSLNSEDLDVLCRDTNGMQLIDLPTGVGFCLYMRGDSIADVGGFDVDSFGRGYGEENDFCLRASARGWRHLCHTGVYVEHVGGASFGDERFELMKDADAVLSQRYPDYQATVEAFLETDPLAKARDALTIARLGDVQQIPSVVAEFSAERKAQLERYYGSLRSCRKDIAALNQSVAEFAEIVAQLRESNRHLVDNHRSLETTYRALETSYGNLNDELSEARLSFKQADEQLYDCRQRLEQSHNENIAVNQLLEVTVNERNYFEAEAQRLAALWPVRFGRWIKRLLRR